MVGAKIQLAAMMALASAEPLMAEPIHVPVRDWKHDDERLRKAEEKRQRKQAKRIAMREGE